MPSCQSPATTAGVIMLQCSGFVTLARSPEEANRLTEMEATPRGFGSDMEDGLVPPKDSLALSLANKRSLPWVHAACTATGHRRRRRGPAPENGHLTAVHEREAQTSNTWCPSASQVALAQASDLRLDGSALCTMELGDGDGPGIVDGLSLTWLLQAHRLMPTADDVARLALAVQPTAFANA
ncbi:hypothetical protein IQ07DRAFT_287176 [Pyrenochaeta sp. DS3sAY3a]|nr:hypothetical protein IQ07DRAFT_287176 [Pyrenochaeta sp. DS3sAY3a]